MNCFKCAVKFAYQAQQDYVELCPLHAAAEKLLEACKKALHPLRYLATHGTLPEGAMPSHLPVLELIAAIAKAESQCTQGLCIIIPGMSQEAQEDCTLHDHET